MFERKKTVSVRNDSPFVPPVKGKAGKCEDAKAKSNSSHTMYHLDSENEKKERLKGHLPSINMTQESRLLHLLLLQCPLILEMHIRDRNQNVHHKA